MDTKLDSEDTTPDFMTAGEVATWLRVGLSTIYMWTAHGRIPSTKFNGVIRFSRHQLKEWLQQNTSCPCVLSDKISERMGGTHPRPLTHRTMVDAAARVKRRLLSTKQPISSL